MWARELAKAAVLVIPPVVMFRDLVGQIQVIAGDSMTPTLKPGDCVFVNKLPRETVQGDIVMIVSPEKRLVKRVTDVRKTEEISMFWVEGDNKENSVDSRNFGEVNSHLIQGKAVAIVFPPWRARLL